MGPFLAFQTVTGAKWIAVLASIVRVNDLFHNYDLSEDKAILYSSSTFLRLWL